MFSRSVGHGNMTVDVSEGSDDCIAQFFALGVFDAEFLRPIVETEVCDFPRIGVSGAVNGCAYIVGRAALQVDAVSIEVETVVVGLAGRCDASNQSGYILCSHSRAVFCDLRRSLCLHEAIGIGVYEVDDAVVILRVAVAHSSALYDLALREVEFNRLDAVALAVVG